MKTIRNLVIGLFGVCAVGILNAQPTTMDVQTLATQATSTYTVLQTATGADGTVCTLYKTAGATISGGLKCSLGNQAVSPVSFTDTSTVSGYMALAQGGVFWLIGENPTSAAVSFGSVGTAPAHGITWSVAAAGAIQTGTVSWP